MAEDLHPTPAEQKLIDAAAKGEIADYRVGDAQTDDPANGAEWGEERILRAEFLYDLCIGARSEWKVHAKGVRAFGARITGCLDFEGAEILAPLLFALCTFDQPISFLRARTRTLIFNGSRCPGLLADGMRVDGDLFLRDQFIASGEVRLLGADVEGDIDCGGGRFENPNGCALHADGVITKGNIVMSKGFFANNEVRLVGAKIGGNLECGGGRFENPNGNALTADGMVTKGDVIFNHVIPASAGLVCGKTFSAKGEVRLRGAMIGGDLNCERGCFGHADGIALNAATMRVTGTLFLAGMNVEPGSEVNLGLAEVGHLYDDVGSWPGKGELVLDGFVYETIAGLAPKTPPSDCNG